MMIKTYLEEQIRKAVKDVFDVEAGDFVVEHPENEEYGDYATNVALLLTKQLKQNPMETANKLSYELQQYDMTFEYDNKSVPIFESIETASPGFINFKLSAEWLKNVPNMLLGSDNDYGVPRKSSGTTVLIEYSQPNPNKPMHVGHARNNFLGSSLANIHRFLGYRTIEANYMNNWGTHICKSMLMYKKYFNGKEPDKKPDHFVGDLYIMYEKKVAEDPSLKNEIAELFQKLEAGDPETVELWEKITGWAYEGWERTYADQGISFDIWFYQSNYTETGKKIIQKAIEKGIAEKDETGAVIARLEKYGIPDKVLLRSDGTSVYATQDLELANDGYEKYHFDKRMYVVDYRQSDYFRQIFKIAQILGYEWADKLYHVAYGTVELPEGKMSSRKGLVVNSDDVYEEVKKAELVQVEDSIKNVTNKDETVGLVSMAAFKYGMLKVDPKQDIVFDVNEVTRFEGNTGPYILYTYARCRSVLDKANYDSKGISTARNSRNIYDTVSLSSTDVMTYVQESKELDILRYVYRFPEVIIDAEQKLSPNVIANFVYELSRRYNSFYSEVPILSATSAAETGFRIVLTDVVSTIIKESMSLLGIKMVERM